MVGTSKREKGNVFPGLTQPSHTTSWTLQQIVDIPFWYCDEKVELTVPWGHARPLYHTQQPRCISSTFGKLRSQNLWTTLTLFKLSMQTLEMFEALHSHFTS